MSLTAVRPFPNFVCRNHGNSSVWVAQEFAGPADVALLADADRLFDGPGCEIIKDQRKIKVARVQIKLGGEARPLYLKRYNAFSWRVLFGSLFRDSGAVRALRGAAVLLEARIATAKPVAVVERRSWGMVTKSFFFTEAIERGKTVDAYWRDDLSGLEGQNGFRRRRGFLRALASLFKSLHGQDIYHGDLKDANILVVPSTDARADCFFLLDLEGIRRYRRLSDRRRIKNLVQLNRTLGRHVRRTEKLYFLARYMSSRFDDLRRKRLWSATILRRSSSLNRKKLAAKKATVIL